MNVFLLSAIAPCHVSMVTDSLAWSQEVSCP
jgi:hypothetical protein